MKENSPQVKKLYNALRQRDIACELEVWDGKKHVDLSIHWAKLDIEIDGLQHFLDPKQIHSDLERAYWSQEEDECDTLHIPNFLIDKYLEKIADALATVARERYEAIEKGDL